MLWAICVGFFFVEAAFIFVDLWSLFLPSWAGWVLGGSQAKYLVSLAIAHTRFNNVRGN